jgi:hypothetical protein
MFVVDVRLFCNEITGKMVLLGHNTDLLGLQLHTDLKFGPSARTDFKNRLCKPDISAVTA